MLGPEKSQFPLLTVMLVPDSVPPRVTRPVPPLVLERAPPLENKMASPIDTDALPLCTMPVVIVMLPPESV